jgi:hypothetical protein
MQDIFENARRMANNAVERAAWEADKLRRASARQREGDLAERERTALMDQIARLVLDLDAHGQLGNASLSALAQRLRTLDGEIEQARSDAHDIRSESFTPGSVAISVVRRSPALGDEVTCRSCGQRSRGSAAFCFACGARLTP